jgi:hypothetical protein
LNGCGAALVRYLSKSRREGAPRNLTLHGQDRKQTIILGTNNNTQQGASASTSNRSLMMFSGTSGLTIENLTIHNLTPQGGSQAEALRLQSCDKCVVRDADILSLQDTLLWDGKIYASNCLIVSNVDYIWGGGAVYFNKCEIRTVGRSGVVVQSRNGTGAYGYVFVDSKFTADSAATGNAFARIDVSVYPGSRVAIINCQLTNISAAGWTVMGGSPTSTGNAISTSGRLSGLTPITASQAATMRDPAMMFGAGNRRCDLARRHYRATGRRRCGGGKCRGRRRSKCRFTAIWSWAAALSGDMPGPGLDRFI